MLDPDPIRPGEVLTLEGDDVPDGRRVVTSQEVDAAVRQSGSLVGLLGELDSGRVTMPVEQFVRISGPLREALNLFRSAKAKIEREALKKISRR